MTEQTTKRGSDPADGPATCTVPGCTQPQDESSFPGCREHKACFDAQAQVETWNLAWKILDPWVESAEPIGSDELTKVMKAALGEVEDNLNLAQDNLELAEAALEREEKRA
ncbi:MAG: hypothetical protein H0U55_09275 [Rubrobacteraceae bacterium]|nr:hypothetical protein [Rubrobacteraceae bacterium]